jgi:hypothetical protein
MKNEEVIHYYHLWIDVLAKSTIMNKEEMISLREKLNKAARKTRDEIDVLALKDMVGILTRYIDEA